MDRHRFTEFILAAEALDRPSYGPFAELLWIVCSRKISRDKAEALYRDCGYIPFTGYPLSPDPDPPRRLSDAELQRVRETNPLCSLGRLRPTPTPPLSVALTLDWTWRDPQGNRVVFVRRPGDVRFSHDVVINGETSGLLARPTRPSQRVAREFLREHLAKTEAG